MAAFPDEQAAVRAVSPVTGHIPSGWKRIVAVVVIGSWNYSKAYNISYFVTLYIAETRNNLLFSTIERKCVFNSV